MQETHARFALHSAALRNSPTLFNVSAMGGIQMILSRALRFALEQGDLVAAHAAPRM